MKEKGNQEEKSFCPAGRNHAQFGMLLIQRLIFIHMLKIIMIRMIIRYHYSRIGIEFPASAVRRIRDPGGDRCGGYITCHIPIVIVGVDGQAVPEVGSQPISSSR